MNSNTFKYVVYIFCVFFVLQANAENTNKKGFEIIEKMDTAYSGFVDSKVNLKMEITNRQGKTSKRNMHSMGLEGENRNGNKTLLIFDKPRDVKGTVLLTWTHKDNDDSQWIYLPAMKRVKRISSNSKTSPFMGSAFTFEDFRPQEIEKYTYEYKKDEIYNGKDCFVVTRYPIYKKSGYKFQHLWIDKEAYTIQKIEMYDKKGKFVKTLTLRKYKKYLSKFWRASELYMEDHKKGKTTLLIFVDYQFQTGITNNIFSKNGIKRVN